MNATQDMMCLRMYRLCVAVWLVIHNYGKCERFIGNSRH